MAEPPNFPMDDGLLVFDADGIQLFIAIDGEGQVTGFNGHVDLGTGIRTALSQIVAEELDVPFGQVRMLLGSTAHGPNQGATIASETIQVTALPLRRAAATARHYLLRLAAQRLGVPADAVSIRDGSFGAAGAGTILLRDLVAGSQTSLRTDPNAPLKSVDEYTIVGRSQARVDIPAKATGRWAYVHDLRLPRMLHGRVVRPPYAGFDIGPHVGHSLLSVDRNSVAGIAGLVDIVVIGDFVGVIAEREENAVLAGERLRCLWRPPPSVPDLNAPEEALRANQSTARLLADRGDVERALTTAALPMDRSYIWPYQMHGSIGPSCAVADCRPDGVTIWSGTQNPFSLRGDIAMLLGRHEETVVIERLEAAGCYGRNCADDVSADAAVLSRAVGRPVRVQLTRQQEHAWEPKGAAQVMNVRGGLDLNGGPAAYDFQTRYPSNAAPTLTLLLTNTIAAEPAVFPMGDRTAVPPYAYGNLRVTVHDMPPIARASWLRGVSALPNSFAHESFIDELATAAGVDPIAYRLRYLTDPRAIDLVKAVAERAQWAPHTAPGSLGGSGDIAYGRGFAYACYVHGRFPGTAAAWAAWVADIAVNKVTGELAVTRVIAGQDSGMLINPDGVRHQIHGNVLQSVSRTLTEQVQFSDTAVIGQEWGAYQILGFPEVPEVDVLMLPRQHEPPLGVGESASVPSAAAIANALFDATGIRFRELPLTPERIRAALNPLPPPQRARPIVVERRPVWTLPSLGAFVGTTLALIAAVFAIWQPAIARVARPDASMFSAAMIERGHQAAAIGACNVCHAGADGDAFAGGRPLETPFGTIYATNITPDADVGIGGWSYTAFERAVRRGVSRDGHYLYPAHPYTAFAKASDTDVEGLYAYLMTRPAVAAVAAITALPFPLNLRPLMAGWNAIFLTNSKVPYDPAKGDAWNRGAELVEGLGHCSGCHTARNALGAEMSGPAHLSGGSAEGWDAPALTGLSPAPVPWTEQAFYDYLRTGWTAEHGPAAGPMADVVASMAPLPDADIAAMAAYLASLSSANRRELQTDVASIVAASDAAGPAAVTAWPIGARLFAGACASCHIANTALTPLALGSALHAPRPDNLLQAVLHGAPAPAESIVATSARAEEIEAMPSFANAFNDAQLTELAGYLRARFAPDKSAWSDVGGALARVRLSPPARVH